MATFTAVAAGGDWRAAATWDVGSGYPVAGDTVVINATLTGTVSLAEANACAILNLTNNGGTLAFGTLTLTVSGLATLQGAITSTSGILSVKGGVTLAGSPSGSFPRLTIAGASTLTSGGFTWGGAMYLSIAGAVVLSGDWINTGLVTYTAATNLNKTAAETLTCNGGLTMTSASGTAPTATIVIGGTGGTWSGTGVLRNNLTFNCTTATVSGTVNYRAGTITYTAGTITTTDSTLTIVASCTLNTNGINWNNVTFSTNTQTATLTSNLTATNTLTISNIGLTFAGAYNISCATLSIPALGARTIILVVSQTLTVSTNLAMNSAVDSTLTIQSSTASTATNLIYQGTAANCKVFSTTFTDIDASGSAQGIDNWYGGTLTRTTNITNRTSADIGGAGVGSFAFFTMGG